MSIRNKDLKNIQTTRWLKQRDKILSTAEKLFWQKGSSGTTIDDIAAAANVNKAMVYYYFKSKSIILCEAASKSLEAVINTAQPVMNSGLPAEKKLEILVTNQIHWSLSRPRTSLTDIIDNKENVPIKMLKEHIARRNYYEGMFRELLSELIPEEKSIHFSPKIGSLLIFSLINSLAHWYRSDGELSMDEIASKTYMFISDALGIKKST